MQAVKLRSWLGSCFLGIIGISVMAVVFISLIIVPCAEDRTFESTATTADPAETAAASTETAMTVSSDTADAARSDTPATGTVTSSTVSSDTTTSGTGVTTAQTPASGTAETGTSGTDEKDTGVTSAETPASSITATETSVTTATGTTTSGTGISSSEAKSTESTTAVSSATDTGTKASSTSSKDKTDTTDTDSSKAEKDKKQKEQKTDYRFEDDRIAVTAILSDAGAVPENAVLTVTPITADADTSKYNEVSSLIDQAVSQKDEVITGFLAYEISFMADGSEYEPDLGSVAVSIQYKNQIFDSDVMKVTEAIKVLHLNQSDAGVTVQDITDSVAVTDSGSSPSETAAESKSDDAGGSASNTVEFTTSSFSTFVVTGVAQSSTISYTSSDLYNALTPILPYAVVADYFSLSGTMNGCIAVNDASICSNFGNTDLNCQYGVTNTQGTIIVQKTYTGSSAKTFTFGLFSGSTCLQTRVLSFSASGTQTATFSVTGSVDGTAVQELDNSKNIIPLNGSYDNVTLTKRENGSKTTTQSCSNTSYIGSFCNMANVQLYDHNKLYIKSNNSNCFVNASGKKIIYHGRDGIYASAANSIGVATTFPDLSGMLDSMETLSAQLAQAKTTDTVLVENYTAWDIEHLGNNQLNFTLNDGQILLLNIDATWDSNLTFSSSSPLRINGTSSGGWSSYAGSVIINVYTKFFNQFCPYSGKIFNVQYIMGILLAPDATVTVQSSYNGNIVANSVYCCYGEIHGCIWNTVTESITWTLVNQEIAVVYTLPATGGIGTGLFYSAGLGLIFLATCLTILLGKRRERSDSS